MAKSIAIKHKGPKFVSYLRVSSDKQGLRGLGIEAQRDAVASFLLSRGNAHSLIAEYLEVESGKKENRPELNAAITHAQTTGANLIIAKLDRLSRDAHFLTGLERAGVDFIACDLPDANRLTITILAAVAEHEREMISARTKAALQVAARRVRLEGQRGKPSIKRLGNPHGAVQMAGLGNESAIKAIKQKANSTAIRLKETLSRIEKTGVNSSSGIAKALNDRGIPTPRGGLWDAKGVIRLRARLYALTKSEPTRLHGA